MLERGCKLVTDDVLPVRINEFKKTIAIPSVSLPSKLWGDSIKKFNIDKEECKRIQEGHDKFYLKINNDKRIRNKVNLNKLFLLNPITNTNGEVGVSSLEGISHLPVILKNIHGGWAIPRSKYIELLDGFFNVYKSTPVYSISYLRKLNNLSRVVDKIYDLAFN